MGLSVRSWLRLALLFCALTGWPVNGASSGRTANRQLPISYQTIAGHLQLLRQCRRQLTFIASVALGAFITRFIKESPLTPLPLPPVKDSPRWTFLTLPLHFADPYLKWMQSQVPKPHKEYQQNLKRMHQSWHHIKSEDSINGFRWKNKYRFIRDLSIKSSPTLVANAVAKVLGSLRYVFSDKANTRQWLLRWCY